MSEIKWTDMSGEERFRVVELARQGEMSIKELCETFGMSRQTLSRAMEKADEAAMAALEPKAPGRKPKPVDQVKAQQLEQETDRLQKDLKHWQTKYEVAKTLIDLQRKIERGERLPGEAKASEKKNSKSRKRRKKNRRR